MAHPRSLSSRLRQAVQERAHFLCEYCHLRQDLCPEPFEIDHVIPQSAGGPSKLSNLCLACPVCNNAKQDRTTGLDPVSGRQFRLFHPRRQKWDRHFRWSEDAGTVIGKTAIGRATVATLDMNHSRVMKVRLIWASLGLHPPT